MRRKTVLVSIYYDNDKEPVISLDTDETWDRPDSLFLNDAIEVAMKHYNPDSGIFDVCIDETKPWLFSKMSWFSRYLFRIVRK